LAIPPDPILFWAKLEKSHFYQLTLRLTEKGRVVKGENPEPKNREFFKKAKKMKK
jgi:hypothetical protein